MCETLLPGPEIEPVSFALAVLSLNHWTVSEVSMCTLTSGWKSPFWSLTPMLQIQIYSLSFLSPALHLREANPSRLHLQLSNCLPSGFRQWREPGGQEEGSRRSMFCNGWLPSLWTPAPAAQAAVSPASSGWRLLQAPGNTAASFVPAAHGVASCFLLISGLFDFLQFGLSAIPPV